MTAERFHKRPSKARWIVLVNVILFALIGFGFGEEYLRNRDIEAEIARMQAENATLEAERLSSLSLIDTLSSAYYVEGEARQSGMGKEGEELIIVQNNGANIEVKPVVSYDDVPNPLRWYYYFFDRAQFEMLQDV
jgi:cell division protein FtsB